MMLLFNRRTAARVVMLAACASWLPGCALKARNPGPPARAAAPPFTLPSHHGMQVSLKSLLETGPAVVVFYRGHW